MSTEPSPALSPARPARRHLLRRIVVRTFWVAVVLAVATVMWALWYVSHRGFTSKWRQILVSEVAKRGVYVSMERLTLDPLRGLTARNVRLHNSKERGKPLAVINEMVLDINYSNLLHHEPFLNAVELHDATVSLPLPQPPAAPAPQEAEPSPAKPQRLEISHINAVIRMPPSQVLVEQAEANVHGLRVVLNGYVANPEKFRMPERSNAEPDVLSQVASGLETLDKLNLTGGRPSLELRFGGDVAKPSSFFAEGVLETGPFTIDGEGHIESARVMIRLADGRVRIDQCEVKDRGGELDATGTFEIATGEAALQVRSTLELPSLIHSVWPSSAINELVLYDVPKLEVSASGNFSGARRVNLIGRFSTGRFAARSLIFEGAEADFSLDSPGPELKQASWYLHGVRIRHKDGEFRLNAMQVPGDFRFNLDSQIPPAVFLPLLPGDAREKLAEWEFKGVPVLHLDGTGATCDPQAVDITGYANLGPMKARGTPIKSAATQIAFKSNVLTCSNIRLERAEGSGSGTVVYDFNTDELQFKNVRTTVNPVEVVRIFDRDIAEDLLPYRFKNRPALIVNGSVGCAHDDWGRNRLRIEVDGAQGMDYTFLGKNLSATKINGVVSVINDRLKLENLDAAVFEGHLRGKADISLRKAAGDYTAELYTDGVDFPSLTKLYFDFDTSKGKFNGSFVFSGVHDSARAIDGTGSIYIADGNVFAIPIFGPFSSILNFVFPGMGYNVAHKGVCTFQMHDGVISTSDLVMEGRGFSIFGNGKLFILEDRMDFFARINAQGLTGKVLTPVSHLLEYVSDGSLMNPAWRPRLLPKMIFPYHPPRPKPSPSPTPSASPVPGASPATSGSSEGAAPGIAPVGQGTAAPAAQDGTAPSSSWTAPLTAPLRTLTRGVFSSHNGAPAEPPGASPASKSAKAGSSASPTPEKTPFWKAPLRRFGGSIFGAPSPRSGN